MSDIFDSEFIRRIGTLDKIDDLDRIAEIEERLKKLKR